MEDNLKQPNVTILQEIYTDSADDPSKCYDLNQWTSWNSAQNSSQNNGNDYETLQDHIFKFGWETVL